MSDNMPPIDEAELEEPTGEEEGDEAVASGHRALADALRRSFRVLKGAMIVLVGFYVLSGLFTVAPQEAKVKLRFGRLVPDRSGRYVLDNTSGLHIRWPWEDVITVNLAEQQIELKGEFWTARTAMIGAKTTGLKLRESRFIMTGDQSMVHMQLLVRYKIDYAPETAQGMSTRNVLDSFISVEDVAEVLRRETMHAATRVVGRMTVDDVLAQDGLFHRASSGRNGITEELEEGLKRFRAETGCGLGIEILGVEPVGVAKEKNPREPYACQRAFEEATQAETDREKAIRDGEQQRTLTMEDAGAHAKQILRDAATEAANIVAAARADADVLRAARELIAKSEGEDTERVLRETYYLDALKEVLSNAPGAFVFHEPEAGSQRELRLLLTRPFTRGYKRRQ